MTVQDVTKAVSNLALAFGDDDVDSGAMVSVFFKNYFYWKLLGSNWIKS